MPAPAIPRADDLDRKARAGDDGRSAVPAILPHRLRPPTRRNPIVERPDLLDRIEAGLAGQMVCVQAPAGFGKTELLIAAFEQLRRADDRFCWMTLESRDAEAGVFLCDLAAAIRLSGKPPRSIGLPVGAGPRLVGQEDALATIAEALASGSVPATVFIDDVHVPASPVMRDQIGAVLRRFPDRLKFVLASRGRPNVSLSVLRTRDLLLELGAADLAFSRQDADALFATAPAPAHVERLIDATGGWPALMTLGRTAFADAHDDEDRAAILAGHHRLFRDFVEEEVLGGLPADLSRALEACTVLDAFPLDLAAHLADLSVDAGLLALFDGLAPVLEAVPQPGRWFRMHPMVLRTLETRASLRPRREAALLHIRAATWFAERGILDLAVRHAAHGGDFALAVEAMRRAGGVNIFLRAGYTTLIRLLADLPATVIQQSSVLRLSHALVLAKEGQIQSARQIIDGLKTIGPGPDTISPADLEHIDGMIDIYEDKNLGDEQIARLRRSAQDFAAYDNWERGWIYNHLCIAHQREGDLRAARHTGLRALTCYREERTPYAQIFMMAHVGTVLMASGRLAAAVNLLRDTDALVKDTQGADANIEALVHIPLATCLYHQGQVEQAMTMLESALPIVKRGEGWVDVFARGYTTMARACFVRRDIEAGLAVLDDAEVLAVERVLPRLDTSVSLQRAELLTRAGLLDSALHVLEALPPISVGVHLADLWPTLRERHEALTVKARLLIRRGVPDEGLALAQHLLASSEAADMGLDALYARLLIIEALWILQRHEDALHHLLALLAVAIPQQATQVVRDGDAQMAGLLRAIVRRFGLTTFRSDGVAYLAAILGPLQPRRMGELTSSAAIILTTREAEVLAGLERGSANKEIARELGLTVAAVKFHLKNLFRKLGVSRRNLALSVARDLGLFDCRQ